MGSLNPQLPQNRPQVNFDYINFSLPVPAKEAFPTMADAYRPEIGYYA
jgi:hypothetical protein